MKIDKLDQDFQCFFFGKNETNSPYTAMRDLRRIPEELVQTDNNQISDILKKRYIYGGYFVRSKHHRGSS